MLPTAEKGGCVGKFIHQKVSCVRWRPSGHAEGGQARAFLTGSWEDGECNGVQLWAWDPSSPSAEPTLLAKRDHLGDVNQIEFVSPDIFCTASSDGSVRLFDISRDPGGQQDECALGERREWKGLHHGKQVRQSCSGISVLEDRVASVGEDGRVALLNANKKDPTRVYEDADSCCLTAVTFIKHSEVLVSNMRGQMNLFDLRSQSNKPTTTYMSIGHEHVGINCIARHPTQAHIVCSGSQDGTMTFWDMRQEKTAMTLLKSHEQAVNEIKFHPTQPDHIFSCSENGDIWHWNGDATRSFFGNNFGTTKPVSADSYCFMNEAAKHRVETHAIMPRQVLPINSLDVGAKAVVVGSDNEAFYIMYNVML